MTNADSPEQVRRRRRPILGFALAASAVVMAAALAGTLWAGVLAAALFMATGLYLAAPRGQAERNAVTAAETGRILDAQARALLESLTDPVLVLDGEGRIVFVNRASHPIIGADAERKHISAVMRMPELLEAVDRVLKEGAPERAGFTIPVPVERHLEAYVARTGGPPASFLVLIQLRDLTAMHRAEQMRADFVANASHELRTPLAAVSGFIETLRGHAKDDTAARERFLEIMSIEAGRMRRLIDDLLSLTRIELNEHNPPSGVTDAADIVRAAAAALMPLAEADGIAIRVADTGPVPVTGDRDELTQVFQNLIHNAIKYGRDAGTVDIAFGRDGSGRVLISVHDQGEGIPREAIPRLTERFYRVDVKRSRERGGTGLGLAIVKHIINRHRGRLLIESVPGVGSTFTVALPAAADETLVGSRTLGDGVMKLSENRRNAVTEPD